MADGIEHEAFSERFIMALERAGYTTNPTKLMRVYNATAKGKSVSVFGVRKWLLGESIPTQDKIQVLASLLGVSPAWLRFGIGHMHADEEHAVLSTDERELLDAYRTLSTEQRVRAKELILQIGRSLPRHEQELPS